MIKAITICADWIKEVRDGHCEPWNYDYKEYIFNENYTEAYSLRIPQNAHGIKAIEMSCGSGIKEEYSRVYFDNDGKVTKLLDLDQKKDPKDAQIEYLLSEVKSLKAERDELRMKIVAIRNAID